VRHEANTKTNQLCGCVPSALGSLSPFWGILCVTTRRADPGSRFTLRGTP